MTSFLRFFLLALTFVLGVSGTFGGAVLFGVVATLVMATAAAMARVLPDRVTEPWRFLALAAPGAVVVTLIDLAVTLGLPGLRSAWGPYLPLLALSPLALSLPQERPRGTTWLDDLLPTAKTGLLLTALLALGGLLREVLGRGTLSLVPGSLTWALPGLSDWPLTLAATGAGAFFLAAAGVVGYRALRPRWSGLASVTRFLEGSPSPTPEAAPATSPLPGPEGTGEWGETLESALENLPAPGTAERRLLVIGCDGGESTWALALRAHGLWMDGRTGPYRVRAVDSFAARIAAASSGVYRDHQLEGIPQDLRDAWTVTGPEPHQVTVAAEVRDRVTFARADFRQGEVYFPQVAHLIVLQKGLDYVKDDKKAALLEEVCSHLAPGGALVVGPDFRREFLPEGMRRTGTSVFRRG